MTQGLTDMANLVNNKKLVDGCCQTGYTLRTTPYRDTPVMKKISKINPIAKLLPKFGKQVIPDKRNKLKDKQAKKDISDGKTSKD